MAEGWYRTTVALGRTLFRALDLQLHVEGVEHLPTQGPVVLAANHIGYLDFMTVASVARDRGRFVRFLTRHDVWNAPVAGRAMTRMRHVPVDRDAPAAAYLHARRLVREGEAVALFPEAGISYSLTVRPLMPGVARLAQETGAPVVPVVQWGTQRIWSVGQRPSPRRGRRVDLRFGPALHVPADADPRVWTATLGRTLATMLDDLQRGSDHLPAADENAPWWPSHLGGQAPDRAAAVALDHVPTSAVPVSWYDVP